MMRLWQGNRYCVRQSFLVERDLSPTGVKNCFSSLWNFLLQDISLFCWYFDHVWWYLVISSVFAPNMKAGKGRRYLQPPSSESHHLQNLWTSRGDDDGDDDGDEKKQTWRRKSWKISIESLFVSRNVTQGPNSVIGLQSSSVFLKEIVYPCWM